MAGAAARYPPDVAPVKALQAGADQLLVPVQMDTAMGAVLNAVKTGAISKKRIDESVYRVLLHKYQRGIFKDPIVDVAAAPQIMGAPQHLADARAITDRTTTLVKNDADLLPLAAGSRKVLVAGWGVGTTQTMATALAARGATTQVRESGTTPSQAAIDSAVAAAAASDLVVVSTNNAYAVNAATGQPTPAAAAQTKLVKALLATGKPVVVAAMRNPYDVASFPEAATVVDTFGYTTDQVESLVRVIFGEVNPVGKLPVSIPKADGSGELFPFGHGLGY
jgi:beta-N-acetylhexosaminidase